MLPLKNRVFLLSRRWTHHAVHSGYDIIGRHIGSPIYADPISDTSLPDQVFWRMTRNMHGYDRTGAALELLAARHMIMHRACLYHALYSETTYNYLGYLNGWRGHQVIASFHHPPSKLAELIRSPEPIRRLSAAILLGQTQYPSFQHLLPTDRIFFVPYAVDTSFFAPPNECNREDNLCLFVGSHLRDFKTLCAVIEDARILAPGLRFVVIAHKNDLGHFDGVVGNYIVHSNVTELGLLEYYRKATLLIQPLQDAVANTALLEGMACGMPMVVTDVGAVREYVNEHFAYFVPAHHPKAMLDAILSLTNDPQQRECMSIKARAQALRFEWSLIAKQMRRVYEQLLDLS